MSEKLFVGNVKEKHVQNGTYDFKYEQVSFKLDDINLMAQHINSSGFVNLKLMTSQRTGGKYMEIDTFKPQGENNG